MSDQDRLIELQADNAQRWQRLRAMMERAKSKDPDDKADSVEDRLAAHLDRLTCSPPTIDADRLLHHVTSGHSFEEYASHVMEDYRQVKQAQGYIVAERRRWEERQEDLERWRDDLMELQSQLEHETGQHVSPPSPKVNSRAEYSRLVAQLQYLAESIEKAAGSKAPNLANLEDLLPDLVQKRALAKLNDQFMDVPESQQPAVDFLAQHYLVEQVGTAVRLL